MSNNGFIKQRMRNYSTDSESFSRTQQVPHIIYDISIDDMDERRMKAKHFPSARQCAEFLGIKRTHQLAPYTSREAIINRKHYTDKRTGKTYAIRQAK